MTKQHSNNSVAAKARRRMEQNKVPCAPEPPGRAYAPRPVPDFTIQIRSRSGDRVQISVTRFGKQFITSEGIKPLRDIMRGMEQLLRHAVP